MKGAKKKADAMRLTVKKTAPKGKAAKDPNKLKRPASAFFVFMEGFRKQFKEENPTITSVVAVGKAGGAKWKSMSESEKAPFVAEAEQRKTAGISSVQSVISDDNLLTEILLKLPVLSLVLFKSVSKRWLSLIKDTNVTFRRTIDPPSGLFLKNSTYRHRYDFSYEFVPLDNRIGVCRSYSLTPKESTVEILDSCNGLLLCSTFSGKLYVYNPSITNMFTALQEPDNVTRFDNSKTGGLKMAFDPTKSPHYKVIYGQHFQEWVRIHTYSSETGNWSFCERQFPDFCFLYFSDGVYLNDAIYWLNRRGKFFKLDIMNEHPVVTALQTPLTTDKMVRYKCRLFESRGCLLLVVKENRDIRRFTIYKKRNVNSKWSVKYISDPDDVIKPSHYSWNDKELIYCIVLGEREEDSFFVMQLDKNVVQYKIVSNTLTTISDLGPDEDLKRCFQFIPSFANV